ncbi:hypothetical protein KGO95_02195 [Patescibacteria group bacterium]|nr:hypothetical protein [Patescibacteria group bacterium]
MKFGNFEQPKKPIATPEEILAAQRAADVAAREKELERQKLEAERAKAREIEQRMLEEDAEKQPRIEITENDVKEAEKQVGKKFEKLG